MVMTWGRFMIGFTDLPHPAALLPRPVHSSITRKKLEMSSKYSMTSTI